MPPFGLICMPEKDSLLKSAGEIIIFLRKTQIFFFRLVQTYFFSFFFFLNIPYSFEQQMALYLSQNGSVFSLLYNRMALYTLLSALDL